MTDESFSWLRTPGAAHGTTHRGHWKGMISHGTAVRHGVERVGTLVFIDGLVKRPELNGAEGIVRSFDDAKGRYGVAIIDTSRVDGGSTREEPAILLKDVNLKCICELPASVMQALQIGDCATVKTFLDGGHDVNGFYAGAREDGSLMPSATLLGLGCLHAQVSLVEMLLDSEANVNLTGSSRETPLMTAFGLSALPHLHDHLLPVMKTLLRHKAQVNAQDRDGVTPLMRASRSGHTRAAKLLLKHGAQIDSLQAVHGGTALTHAAYEGSLAGVRCLLEANACTTIRVAAGATALQIAESRGHMECAKAIREHQSTSRPEATATGQRSAPVSTARQPVGVSSQDSVPSVARASTTGTSSVTSDGGGSHDNEQARADAVMASLLAEEEARAQAESARASKNAKKKARKKAARAATTGAAAGEASSSLTALQLEPVETGAAAGERFETATAEEVEAATELPVPPVPAPVAMQLAARAPTPTAEAATAAARRVTAPEPPDEFVCPISQELMLEPVLATDGHTYERQHIERWFEQRLTSPKTGELLQTSSVFPNHSMRRMIIEWREQHGV